MKKIWILVFFLLIFPVSFNISFATSNVADIQEMSPTPIQQINYELPYPGLLPDSPLYFLKMARDAAVGFLIADSLKKAEFNLLLADKRLNSALFLFNSSKNNPKKIELVHATASKGENYFEKALEKAKEAKKEGKDTADLLRRLKEGARKHQEVLKTLGFTSEAQRALGFQKEIESLK